MILYSFHIIATPDETIFSYQLLHVSLALIFGTPKKIIIFRHAHLEFTLWFVVKHILLNYNVYGLKNMIHNNINNNYESEVNLIPNDIYL